MLAIFDIKVVSYIKFSNKFFIITNNIEFKYIKIDFLYLYIY